MGVCTFRRKSTKAASKFDVLDPHITAQDSAVALATFACESNEYTVDFPSPVTPLVTRKLATKFRFCIFKIALKPSSIPAEVSNFRNLSVSGKEGVRGRKVGLRNSKSFLPRNTPLRLVKPQNDFIKLPIGKKVYICEK